MPRNPSERPTVLEINLRLLFAIKKGGKEKKKVEEKTKGDIHQLFDSKPGNTAWSLRALVLNKDDDDAL